MMTFSKVFKTGLAAAVFMVGIATTARGQVDTGGCNGAPVGGVGRGLIHIKGTVLCANCTLEDVQHRQPNNHKLYQFTHRKGELVMQVSAVNDSEMFEFSSPRIAMRAPDHLFQQLTVEENLFREVEIMGVLNNTHTLDMFRVLPISTASVRAMR